MAIFSASRMKALLVLKDLQPNRPNKPTYLANHKKTGLWPWTQLLASPCTVLCWWKSVVDHIDHFVPRAPRRWTAARPRKGTTRSRGRRGNGCARGEEYVKEISPRGNNKVIIYSKVFRGFSGHSENFCFLHIKQHHGNSAENSVSSG